MASEDLRSGASAAEVDLKEHVRAIPDFPEPGIIFRDVTPLFSHVEAFDVACARLAETFRTQAVQMVAGVEARGFILGGAIARELGLGFAPVRKKGKLPWRTISADYQLEYGSATLEMHVDAIPPNTRVGIVDDLIATGGTALATIDLIRRLDAEPAAFGAVIDLPELGGADRIAEAGVPVSSLIAYEGH
ncbi:MAG: adenine phosphoribosyltransferase [Neomegalonema sp.]|nr:adenine phosphoribosyltransferase [Neomegalonema sp.]